MLLTPPLLNEVSNSGTGYPRGLCATNDLRRLSLKPEMGQIMLYPFKTLISLAHPIFKKYDRIKISTPFFSS
jgi:hypothetical protein